MSLLTSMLTQSPGGGGGGSGILVVDQVSDLPGGQPAGTVAMVKGDSGNNDMGFQLWIYEGVIPDWVKYDSLIENTIGSLPFNILPSGMNNFYSVAWGSNGTVNLPNTAAIEANNVANGDSVYLTNVGQYTITVSTNDSTPIIGGASLPPSPNGPPYPATPQFVVKYTYINTGSIRYWFGTILGVQITGSGTSLQDGLATFLDTSGNIIGSFSHITAPAGSSTLNAAITDNLVINSANQMILTAASTLALTSSTGDVQLNAPMGSILLAGTSLNVAAGMTNGQLIIGKTAAPATIGLPTGDGNIVVTPGAGSLAFSLASPIDVDTTGTAAGLSGATIDVNSPGAITITSTLNDDGAIALIATQGGIDISTTEGIVSITALQDEIEIIANGNLTFTGAALALRAGMTDGQLIIGDTGSAAVISTLTSSNGITITNGPGSISIVGGSPVGVSNQATQDAQNFTALTAGVQMLAANASRNLKTINAGIKVTTTFVGTGNIQLVDGSGNIYGNWPLTLLIAGQVYPIAIGGATPGDFFSSPISNSAMSFKWDGVGGVFTNGLVNLSYLYDFVS